MFISEKTKNGNVGTSEISQEVAEKQALNMDQGNNFNCTDCKMCEYCNNCDNCLGCTNCKSCKSCIGCKDLDNQTGK